MKIFSTIIIFGFFSCNSLVKNEDVKVVDEVMDTSISKNSNSDFLDKFKDSYDSIENARALNEKELRDKEKKVNVKEDLIGSWVGWFKKSEEESDNNYDKGKMVYVDEGFVWSRENKICVTIESIQGDKVVGHSVAAGNSRKFTGTCTENKNNFEFNLLEPGDNKYDGNFFFNITKNDSRIQGTWKSFKKINIENREYELIKRSFQYKINQQLDEKNYRRFVDWEKTAKNKYDKELEETSSDFVSATDQIYKVNASFKLLTIKDVENLKKGDLLIIRNMIYARHGYSFKNRPLRVFFDAQDWYIPVSNDVKAELTEIEKKNIQLLMKYEKNAKEYYDYFGRG